MTPAGEIPHSTRLPHPYLKIHSRRRPFPGPTFHRLALHLPILPFSRN